MYIPVCKAPLAPPRRIEVTTAAAAGAAQPAAPRPAPPRPPVEENPFLAVR